jgi:RNA polymerase sigma-70 factor (ECF subfamily)
MEQEQFKKEVVPLRSRLIAFAQRMLMQTEDAEDVVQEVFLKLWNMRRDLERYDSIPALSVQITKRLCLNRLKAMRRPVLPEDAEVIDGAPLPDVALEQKDSVRQVIRLIDRLPGQQQAVLRMKHIDGLEVDEIAALTGSSPETVRMNLSRARKRIRELFLKM